MPEMIEEDRMASLFNEFRAVAGREILPPGTLAVRETVRRRRTNRLIGTAALALVGLAGAALGIVNVSGGEGAPVDPVGANSFGPTLDPEERDRLGVEALGLLGYRPSNDSGSGLLAVRPGVIFGGVATSAAASTYEFGTAQEPFPQGEYQLHALCLGRGKVSLGWSTAGGIQGSLVLDCGNGDEDRHGYGAFTALVPGILKLTVTPDDRAKGRAGLAVVVTDPRIVLARNALGEPGPDLVLGGESIVPTGNIGGVDESGADVGDYRLSMACVGAGSIDVTFTIGGASHSDSLACTKAGVQTSLTVGSSTAGATMSVVIEPDSAATGQAAIAYRVTKLWPASR